MKNRILLEGYSLPGQQPRVRSEGGCNKHPLDLIEGATEDAAVVRASTI